MKIGFLSAILLGLAWGGVVRAAQPAPAAGGLADEAQFHFLRGNRAYQEKRFEDALTAYYSSNRLVPNRNVQFNIARCLDRLGRYDEAYRAWSTLLDQALPEKERKAAREAIDELRPHLALLEITSDPPGATIYAGRRDLGALGVTPRRLALPPAPTIIILERDGYRPVDLPAEPVHGKEIHLTARLDRIFGELEIRRVPDSAEVRRDFLDGELLRRGPGTVRAVPGALVLFISAPGFQTARVPVEVLPDTRVPVDALLAAAEPPTGTLVVRCNIPSALIRIDDREAGFSPAVIDGVPTGTRRIEIAAEGRRPFSASVEVKRSQRSFVDGYLGHADPEVTAATKSSIASESAPASVTVVTADEIAAFGYTSLAEALAGVRGAIVSNDRSYESIGFRGFSPPGDYTNRVLVLVDGHVTNDAVTGQGYVGHDFDVDLANVARIEVVRGPGSVLYGTGALFGVINVVTRRAAEGGHGSLEGMAGTQGYGSGRATASVRTDASELMLSAAAMSSAGDHRYLWAPELTGGVPATVYDGDGESAQHADVVEHMGPFSFRASYNHRRKYLPTGAYGTQPVAGSFNDDHRTFAELRFDLMLAGLGIAARAAYDASWYHGHFIEQDPLASTEQTLTAKWLTGELRFELPTFWRQHFTVGGELVRQLDLYTDAPAAGNPPIPDDLILSTYLVDDVRIARRLRANLGLRSDSYTRTSGTTISPRLALIAKPYQAGNTKLFVGRSFRAPSPNELANSPTGHLSPETIWSVELEHTHRITDDFQLIGSLFANWLDHFLSMANAPEYTSVFENSRGRIRSLGAEGEARWEPGGGMLAAVSFSRQRVEILDGLGTPFFNAPQSLFKARFLCPLMGPALRLGSELVLDTGRPFRQPDPSLQAVDNRTDDALLWNVSVSGGYRPYGLRYFAGVFNLLDVRDARAGFPTSVDYLPTLVPRYGRSIRAGLALDF